MAENPRIEDLRKRYHENPRRFFAPLANEYRKSGFLDRALLLCQKHIPEQPENMNGLVVYGQTLFESQRTDEAREPFERALALDPENLIALRHLGDIARINGDVPAAKSWYTKVLEFDRRNDEVLDLLAELGGSDTPTPEAPRSSTAASAGLVSFSDSVSMSSGQDIGMIDLDAPAAPEAPSARPPAPVGPGKTVVINAQALAARDREEAAVAEKVTQPVASIPSGSLLDPPSVEAPSARPSKRASLLDINFDFSETAAETETLTTPAAPVMGAEAAEYGFSDALTVETSGDVAPLTTPEQPKLPAGDFELAEFNAEVAPLAGLEATEFTSDAVAPLDGLDRVNVTADDVEPLSGLAGLPLLDEASASPTSDLPMLDDASAEPILESPSTGRPKPRMTKASMASLPLLADFGLDEDEPASSKLTPIITPAVPAPEQPSAPSVSARASKATPTFVTETMAALYVQQGHLPEAIDVYRQLVEQTPDDAGLKAKLAELQRMHASEQIPTPPAADEVDMPEFDAPAGDAVEPEPAAANAAMAGVSFGGIGLVGQGTAAPIVTPAVPAGPTAREFFGGFARRAVQVAVAVAAVSLTQPDSAEDHEPVTAISSGASWPLDALFGAAQDVRDLAQAELLAGVATFTGPDGGTGLDEMFSAQAQPARRAVPRASEMLKFDQFFQAPGAAAEGSAAPSAPAAPEGSSGPSGDDLGKFQGWLKGLKT